MKIKMETLKNQKSENLRKALERLVKEDPSMPIIAIDISESPEDFYHDPNPKYLISYGRCIPYDSGPGILGR